VGFPKPPYAAAIEDFCGIGVEWDAEETTLTIAARWLQASLPGSDRDGHRRAVEQCRLILERHSSPAGLAARARSHLAVHHSLAVTLPQVGGGARASPSAACGGTWRRRARASGRCSPSPACSPPATCCGPGMTVEEAAERMGYSEPSAFSHAFKRWSGRSPESWRKSPAASSPP
jgi:AraC-like DNA-binding protein